MISEYDLSFGYEYRLFESLNPVCQTAGEKVCFIVVRVECGRFSRVSYERQVILIDLPIQSPMGPVSLQGDRPPAGAGAGHDNSQLEQKPVLDYIVLVG